MTALLMDRAAAGRVEDRYDAGSGRVFMSGIQALVRLLLDQHRADAAAGLRVGTLVSGYQGSPLGGLDKAVAGLGELGEQHGIVHRPGVNEELGATAVWGSQVATQLRGAQVDGVVGVWYGKAPGVDRAADAIRHGNHAGTDPRGGVLALCGDDPACKSSTLPSASEGLLSALQVPVIAPGSVQELLDLGRHAIACSRASGLWVALKVVTAIADATATVEVGHERITPVMPQLDWQGTPYVHRPSAHFLAPQSLEMERTLHEVRLPLAVRYAQQNGLNRIIEGGDRSRLGVVAAGYTFHQLAEALDSLELPDALRPRLLKLGMIYPLDREIVREFAAGLTEVLVLEDKAPFLEPAIRDALYPLDERPAVVGKADELGRPLVPTSGMLDVTTVARLVAGRVASLHELPGTGAMLRGVRSSAPFELPVLDATRQPAFCSGCPHNLSTRADDDELVGAGIGCHTMVVLNPAKRGRVAGLTQMGGEGAQWVGVSPFIEPQHFTQNLGDGTFHHSGSLAIRAAVAAGIDVTYKLLYNGTVAMTGGQQVEGSMSIPALVRSLEAEGVSRIVITTDEPGRYRGMTLPALVEVRPREELLRAQRELAATSGVSVLIHDQACATELRRARKRGKVETPAQRVLINERVCEGCGDCGAKSSCLSVEPVQTPFGRKTRIHQSSCNQDFSCLEGDCPSFLTVIAPKDAPRKRSAGPPEVTLPLPEPAGSVHDVHVRLIGIGGTGVVTVSQLLGMAALLDGKHAAGLDQTGLSQKAGPVSSDVRISTEPIETGAEPPAGRVDVMLAFDLVAAVTPAHLRSVSVERTLALASTTVVPTAQMVLDVDAPAPDVAAACAALERGTRRAKFLDAVRLAEVLFGDHVLANVILLGAAWQAGGIPLSVEAMREAFRVNGAAVEKNLAAFEWGRAAVARPELVDELLAPESRRPEPTPAQRRLIDQVAPAEGPLREALMLRVPDLAGWGGARAAARYVERVAALQARVGERLTGEGSEIVAAFAANLHKLTAYKDEYEVARLHLEGLAGLPAGTKFHFHLHPPLLRALGLKRKLKLGRWFVPAFRVLRRGRVLRGTPLDVFGWAHVRRVERALPGEYLALMDQALDHLSPDTAPLALEIAALPDLVRGYEDIKLASVEHFRERADQLRRQLPEFKEETF